MIDVTLLNEQDPMKFKVRIPVPDKTDEFNVTMSHELFKRINNDSNFSPEHIVESVFKFLLDREPVESILPSFDISIVSHYFPEFNQSISAYFD